MRRQVIGGRRCAGYVDFEDKALDLKALANKCEMEVNGLTNQINHKHSLLQHIFIKLFGIQFHITLLTQLHTTESRQ